MSNHVSMVLRHDRRQSRLFGSCLVVRQSTFSAVRTCKQQEYCLLGYSSTGGCLAVVHSTKCTAWVAISKHHIIGPYWFEDENERAQTVNTERYVAVLMKFWASLGRRRGIDRDEQWFQQDGATPHISNYSLAWLRERFEYRLICRECEIEWAAHSPDLKIWRVSQG